MTNSSQVNSNRSEDETNAKLVKVANVGTAIAKYAAYSLLIIRYTNDF